MDYTQQVAVQSLESMLYLHFCSGMWFQLLWAVLFGFTYLAVHKSEFTYHNNSLCCCTVFHTISVLMWIRHNRSAVTRGNSTPPLPFYCCIPFTPNVYNVWAHFTYHEALAYVQWSEDFMLWQGVSWTYTKCRVGQGWQRSNHFICTEQCRMDRRLSSVGWIVGWVLGVTTLSAAAPGVPHLDLYLYTVHLYR